jgi:negative regulator of sigma-B (phosphoserine phosphatase)
VKSLRVNGGVLIRSYEGLISCGDAAVIIKEGSSSLYCVVDGLGHGPDAELSATRAVATLRANAGRPLPELFGACDRALVGMRGAVMSVIRHSGATASFAGIGNVEIFGPKGVSRPITVAGVIGRGQLRTVREFELPVVAGHRWVLATDGLRSKDLSRAMEVAALLPPTQAAAKLIEVAGRADDDCGVAVLDFSEPQYQESLTLRGRADAVGAGLHVKTMASAAGWPTQDAEELSLLIIELCGNAVRHAGGGVCHVALDAASVDVVVDDDGPGLPDWVLERHAKGSLIESAPERSVDGGAATLRARENSKLGAGLDSARRLAEVLTLQNRTPKGARVSASRTRR